jgi:hypothetical protein
MAFCKRCFMEFKREWRRLHPGQTFNVNMKDVIFKCQLVTFDHDGYGETRARIFDCNKKEYYFLSQKEYLEKSKQGLVP